MKVPDLQAALIREGISEAAYSLHGGLPNEAYCLGPTREGWEVYYSERGGKAGLRLFRDEEAACDYFYQRILADATTRAGR
jgi:hypothetical protein